MKRIIYIASILSILNTGIGWSKEFSVPEQTDPHLTQIKTLANTLDDDRFKNWTEEQYKHYEDSMMAKCTLKTCRSAHIIVIPPCQRQKSCLS